MPVNNTNANTSSVNNAENVLKYQLLTQMLKSTVGEDSPAFGAVMESIMNSMNGENGVGADALGLSSLNGDLSQLGYGAGEPLQNAYSYVKDSVSTGNTSIDSAIKTAAQKYNVDPEFIKAIIKQESDFDPKSVSSAGAMGLMQLMPENCKDYGVSNPYDINQNIDAGTRQLKDYLNMYSNNKEMALAAYNAGPTRMRRRGITDTSQFGKLPNETQNYVKKVMNYYSKKL